MKPRVYLIIVITMLQLTLSSGCGKRGGHQGHELAAQASNNAKIAYDQLRARMQEEFVIVHGRLNELQSAVVEVLAPQASRIANATEFLAETAYNFSLTVGKSLDKFNIVLDELTGGVRLAMVILLLIGGLICQGMIGSIGNTLKPTIQTVVTKTFLYILQIFCCFCAFGVLADFFVFYVLQLKHLETLSPEVRAFVIYVSPLLFFVVFYLFGFALSILYEILNIIKFVLYCPYIMTIAPYVHMYQTFKYRRFYRNRTGVYISMISVSVFPLCFVGVWQVVNGRKLTSYDDIHFDINFIYSLLITHAVYFLEALILRSRYPSPELAMINSPYHERRYLQQ